MIAVLWLALGTAVMAALWVAHQAEVRTARLLAAVPGWQDEELYAAPRDRSAT